MCMCLLLNAVVRSTSMNLCWPHLGGSDISLAIYQCGEWTIQMGTTASPWLTTTMCLSPFWQRTARQQCQTPLDPLGRHVTWCTRHAREFATTACRISWLNTTKAFVVLSTYGGIGYRPPVPLTGPILVFKLQVTLPEFKLVQLCMCL